MRFTVTLLIFGMFVFAAPATADLSRSNDPAPSTGTQTGSILAQQTACTFQGRQYSPGAVCTASCGNVRCSVIQCTNQGTWANANLLCSAQHGDCPSFC